MSITPQNLPKRTRILVKDLLFQEKYTLTDTQVDIMSYIFNAFTWAMKVDGYMVLTSKKILGDLPQIGEKTLDATLRELANNRLISRSLVTVKSWGNARVRGIKISSSGMEYNSSIYTPTHQAIVNVCHERIAELEEENRALKAEKSVELEDLSPKSEPVEDKGEAKAVDSVSVEAPPTETPVNESLDDFAKKIRNRFILTSQPICNNVEGWQKETTFYINSYGKLSITTKNMDFSQLTDPILINKFWKWLYLHQERIGDVREFKSLRANIKELNQKYRNSKIKIDGKIRWVEKIIDMGSGFSLKIRDDKGKIFVVRDGLGKPRVYGYEVFEM